MHINILINRTLKLLRVFSIYIKLVKTERVYI